MCAVYVRVVSGGGKNSRCEQLVRYCQPLGCTFCTRKVPTQIFGNVRCPILHIKANSKPQCWCSLASNILKKSRLNWKLKISNAADNAEITQLQAHDTRYRPMQELNSLCISK